MSPPLGSSSLPSVPSDFIVQARYRGARRRLFRLRDTLSSVTDSTSANDWITSFGKAMDQYLAASRPAGQVGDDAEVTVFLAEVQRVTGDYATAAWIELAPSVVAGIEPDLHGLPPGETLGGFPAHRVSPPLVPHSPSTPVLSQSSSVQPVARPVLASGLSPPDKSHTSSSTSAVTPSISPNAGPSDRPIRPFPKKRRRGAVQFAGVLLSRPATQANKAVAVEEVSPEEVLRQKFVASGALSREDRPPKWGTCAACRSRKTICTPAVLDRPPYGPCFHCLSSRQTDPCVREFLQSNRSTRASLGTRSQPSPEPSEHASEATPSPTVPPPGGNLLSAVPPEVPLRGSDKVPLSHLLSWRSEILAAQRVGTMARVEHTTAKAALKAAELSEKIAAERIVASDKRLRTAWWQYHFLFEDTAEASGSSQSTVKASRKRKAPRASFEDDLV